MAIITIGDRALLTMVGTLCGQRVLNTFLYRVADALPDADYDDAGIKFNARLAVVGSFRDKFLACLPTNYSLNATWFQVISPIRLRKQQFGQSLTGQFLDLAYTPNVQGSITRSASTAGRSSIGGVRLPIGTSSVSTSEGLLTPDLFAQFYNFTIQMQSTIITLDPNVTYVPQVGVPKGPVPSKDMFAAFVQNTTRVIRRRTVGHGI